MPQDDKHNNLDLFDSTKMASLQYLHPQPQMPMKFRQPVTPTLIAGKIKRSDGQKYYALRIASIPGIYKSWTVASKLINGCPGAKYKSFFSLEDSVAYIKEQFPESEFKIDGENFLIANPEPIYEAIDEARAKKEKIMGLLIKDDYSSMEKLDPDYPRLAQIIKSLPNLKVDLNEEQLASLAAIKEKRNVIINAGVNNIN